MRPGWFRKSTLTSYDPERLSLPKFPDHIDAQRPQQPAAPFSNAQLRRARHGYYAMISEVDHYVGRILKSLDAKGKRNDTIVVFTSDHGEWLGEHLRYGKGYPADDAVSRVPLIISAPGGRRGRPNQGVVEAVDIVPTLLELAAIQIPTFLQGQSLVGAVERGEEPRKAIALTEGDGWKSLRTDRFRYLVHADGRECLWDIDADPGEYFDVSGSGDYANALADCRKTLLQRLLEIERPLPRVWTY